MITLLFFAALREQVGTGQHQISIPPQIRTVGALRTWLVEQKGWKLTESGQVHCAVNQSLATEDGPVGPNDEVAFFPPMTGG